MAASPQLLADTLRQRGEFEAAAESRALRWWADAAAALAMVPFMLREGLETIDTRD